MLSMEQLQARRAMYVQALAQVREQAAAAARQVTIQEGAIAAIDDLLKLIAPETAPLDGMTMEELQNGEFVPA